MGSEKTSWKKWGCNIRGEEAGQNILGVSGRQTRKREDMESERNGEKFTIDTVGLGY